MKINKIKTKFEVGDKVYYGVFSEIYEYTIKEIKAINYRLINDTEEITIFYEIEGDYNHTKTIEEKELCSSYEEAVDKLSTYLLKCIPNNKDIVKCLITKLENICQTDQKED